LKSIIIVFESVKVDGKFLCPPSRLGLKTIKVPLKLLEVSLKSLVTRELDHLLGFSAFVSPDNEWNQVKQYVA
jgi:hypothetical protein